MLGLYVMVMDTFRHLPSTLRQFASEQTGQDAFEYMLVIGGVTVAAILAVTTPIGTTLAAKIVAGVCTSIKQIPNMTNAC